MPQIKLNTRGLIKAGRWAGRHILIEDQVPSTGGYLILLEPEGEAIGSDVWIAEDALDRAFEQAAWEIEWEGDS
jgi:hypothetical protein